MVRYFTYFPLRCNLNFLDFFPHHLSSMFSGAKTTWRKNSSNQKKVVFKSFSGGGFGDLGEVENHDDNSGSNSFSTFIQDVQSTMVSCKGVPLGGLPLNSLNSVVTVDYNTNNMNYFESEMIKAPEKKRIRFEHKNGITYDTIDDKFSFDVSHLSISNDENISVFSTGSPDEPFDECVTLQSN